MVSRLESRFAETPLSAVLTSSALLVPVPRSELLQPGTLWVPYLICQALVRHGFGREVVPCLQRVVPIRKSARAVPSERPTALEHFKTMAVGRLVFPHDDVVLVDDVITRGATMLAAASLVQRALPGTRVRGFALVRTVSNPVDFAGMFAPAVGTITLRQDGQTSRRP